VRRTLVPPEITRMIGDCHLSRQGAVRVFAGLHGELPQQYARFRRLRHPADDRLFFFFVAVGDEGLMHTFTFHIDDATSPEHLIVVDLEHSTRPRSQ
jgi:hypothetical protein